MLVLVMVIMVAVVPDLLAEMPLPIEVVEEVEAGYSSGLVELLSTQLGVIHPPMVTLILN